MMDNELLELGFTRNMNGVYVLEDMETTVTYEMSLGKGHIYFRGALVGTYPKEKIMDFVEYNM